MKKRFVMNREGFWADSRQPHLPTPRAETGIWDGKGKFLTALAAAEAEAQHKQYKGSSVCRICDCRNGSAELSLGNWVWPAGFAHYVEEHNVRPSLAFEEFIISERL